MPAILLDGQKIAQTRLLQIKKEVDQLAEKPGLAAILIGQNQASKIYLKLKQKACLQTGINFHSYYIDKNNQKDEIVKVINFLNNDPSINGILLQLPLPQNFDKNELIDQIEPKKDVDGFRDKTMVQSPLIQAVMELINQTKINYKNTANFILCNSQKFYHTFNNTYPQLNLNYLDPQKKQVAKLKNADIVIIGIGQAKFLQPAMIKKDAIIIDIGINKNNGSVIGDVDPLVDQVASFRSPVPGGVGPVTISFLLENLLKLHKIQQD